MWTDQIRKFVCKINEVVNGYFVILHRRHIVLHVLIFIHMCNVDVTVQLKTLFIGILWLHVLVLTRTVLRGEIPPVATTPWAKDNNCVKYHQVTCINL